MAMTVTAITSVKVVDGGVTAVDREFKVEFEVTGKVEGDYWLDTASAGFTLCVKGTNISAPAIVDPFVVGLTTIRGIAIASEINLEISVNGADPVKMAEGNMMIGQAEMQTIQLNRDDTRTGQVQFIVWGDR
jgi:hypothetical protein